MHEEKKKNQGYEIFGLKSYCSNYSVFGNPITLKYDISTKMIISLIN